MRDPSRTRLRRPTSLAVACATLLLALVATPPVFADDPTPQRFRQTSAQQPRTGASFDGWVLSMERGAPSSAYMCGKVPVGGPWAVHGCGSGAGFLYPALPNETDMAHFRAQHTTELFPAAASGLEIGPGVGFAEVHRGPDESGFRFDPAREPRPIEASGPEAAVELQWASTDRAGPLERLRVNWDAGVAWIPGAPAVTGAPSAVVPFSTVTINGRF